MTSTLNLKPIGVFSSHTSKQFYGEQCKIELMLFNFKILPTHER